MARKHICLLSTHKNITVQHSRTQGLMNALLNKLTESFRVAIESTSIRVKYFQKDLVVQKKIWEMLSHIASIENTFKIF